MREEQGDLWERGRYADAIVITTNGYVKGNGALVMGAGVAGQAQEKKPGLPLMFGSLVKKYGNHVHYTKVAMEQGSLTTIVTFPVKHVWYDRADIDLIIRSAQELKNLADEKHWEEVVLPRPGCGNGKLEWKEVRPMIKKILDDRFVVVQK